MTSLMSLCGAASVATAGDKDWQSWAVARAGPGFPFGGKGSKPQVSRAGIAFGFRNPGGYMGVKNPMKKLPWMILA